MFSKIELAAALLFAAFYLPSICKAQALQWQVNKTEEIIFGQTDIELICSGTACCAGNPREWIGGPSSISIMRDGTPSDAAKYKETLNTGSFSLIIKALELKDVKVQYQCVIDFDSSPSTELIPTEDVFRYVPDVNSDIEIVKNFNGSNIYLRANLTRVFPVPLCTAFFEETNITSSMVLTTSENEPIKYTVIEMNSISYQCDSNEGSLVISCYVGSISFTVFQENLCQSTDSCDFNYCYCVGYILLAVFIASGISTLVVYLWWKIKRKEIKAKSILCWLAEHKFCCCGHHIFCCCSQKIKSCCEKYKNSRICGAPVLLLADIFVIGMVVSIVVWFVSLLVVIFTYCACKEWPVKGTVAGISFVVSLFASSIWTLLVLIVYCIVSCCKNNGD